jgi:hypothetical protein
MATTILVIIRVVEESQISMATTIPVVIRVVEGLGFSTTTTISPWSAISVPSSLQLCLPYYLVIVSSCLLLLLCEILYCASHMNIGKTK